MTTHRWLRPRYTRDGGPGAFHAATRDGASYATACAGRWPASDETQSWPTTAVTDEIASDGVGSGAYATVKCKACVEKVGG